MAGFLSDLVQYRRLWLMIVVLGIGGTHLSGFQMSVINYTSLYIQKFINETWLERYGSVLPQETLMLLWSLIVSVYCMGGMIGCLCSGYLAAKFGKKKCLLLNDLLLITATLLTGFSRRAKAFEMILAGRFLEGIGAAGKWCPPSPRNGHTPRDLLGTEDMWNVLLSFSGLVALIQLLFLPFFPESPPYLLLQKEDKAGCLKAMKQLWGEDNYHTEFDDLMKEKAITKGTKIMNVLEVLRERSVYPQLCTMLLLLLSLQLCGMSAITFYTSEIFRTANLQESIIPYVSLGVSISELISIIFCSSIIDRFGRRTLLCGGYLLMALILVLLETSLLLSDQFLWLRYCSVVLIFLFIIAYGIGPAGAVVSVMNEIFTLSARASAFVIGGIIIWLGLTFTGMIFPFAVMLLGPFCFLIFIVVLIISAVVIYLFLPETKGKSTSEITEKFKTCQFFKRKRHQAVEMHAAEEKTFCTKL
ncbi:PREDICTED: solute carrier family 2, facilitated glucose transporter member 11-like isoform X2 [Pseudopodoces humilis]|uniref:solute carrier family 2, facilitated glucose transporter member 11-like isoform X2 n=1 Tax=Pseudopodoces humilis TaxID=181119 RepID=UPI0006B75373|nr:PREDICTED: solute carrier family 2, facilitated glucose transporter member 11-like isoform X2 [Pseudopodoces humilis]